MSTSVPEEAVAAPQAGERSGLLAERQVARATMRFGRHFRSKAEVNVSTGGILAIAALVGGILLATSVLVGTSIRESARLPR